MSGNNAAGVPPTGGSDALATGAAAGGAGPAAAPEAGATEGGGGSPGEAAAPASPPAPAAQPRMLIAASPGMGEGTDVRIKLTDDVFGVGVVTGRRNFDGTYPVAGRLDDGQCGPAANLFHHQQVYTVAEYEREYASRQGRLPGMSLSHPGRSYVAFGAAPAVKRHDNWRGTEQARSACGRQAARVTRALRPRRAGLHQRPQRPRRRRAGGAVPVRAGLGVVEQHTDVGPRGGARHSWGRLQAERRAGGGV